MYNTKTEFGSTIFKILEESLGIGGHSYKDGTVVLEVPGFTKADLKITIKEGIIRVDGKKEILGESKEIHKRFALPEGALNSDDPITAKVENGLLFINLKKSERSKQTNVDIL